jgi:hypothetical protein
MNCDDGELCYGELCGVNWAREIVQCELPANQFADIVVWQ